MAVAIAGSMAVILMTWRSYADLYDPRLIQCRFRLSPWQRLRSATDLPTHGQRAPDSTPSALAATTSGLKVRSSPPSPTSSGRRGLRCRPVSQLQHL
jgi:hypothetical protein